MGFPTPVGSAAQAELGFPTTEQVSVNSHKLALDVPGPRVSGLPALEGAAFRLEVRATVLHLRVVLCNEGKALWVSTSSPARFGLSQGDSSSSRGSHVSLGRKAPKPGSHGPVSSTTLGTMTTKNGFIPLGPLPAPVLAHPSPQR